MKEIEKQEEEYAAAAAKHSDSESLKWFFNEKMFEAPSIFSLVS